MRLLCVASAFALTALLLTPVNGHAAQDDEYRVYTAMPGYGREIKINGPKANQKELGGLRCRELKTMIAFEGSGYLTSYECKLSRRHRDDAAIYNALMVAPKRDKQTSQNEIVDVKAVGNLKCRRTQGLATGNGPILLQAKDVLVFLVLLNKALRGH